MVDVTDVRRSVGADTFGRTVDCLNRKERGASLVCGEEVVMLFLGVLGGDSIEPGERIGE